MSIQFSETVRIDTNNAMVIMFQMLMIAVLIQGIQ